MARLSKLCVIRISTDRLYFVISDSSNFVGSPYLWTELDQGHYFSEFHLDGVSVENNEIYLEVQPGK